MTFDIDTGAPWYRGSGQSVAAIRDGVVIDAVYSGINVERRDRAALAAKHPGAKIVAGMLSSYQLTLFDPTTEWTA